MSIKTTKKIGVIPSECRICGVPAKYSYCGVVVCDSCKMFFRRNAITESKTLVCHFDGQCEININNRHTCSACRLSKCFKCGMDPDKFRPSRQYKSKKNTLVKIQEQQLPERLPTLNLLQSDQSLLTTNQWTLLTQLLNCYKESEVLLFTQRLMNKNVIQQFTFENYTGLVEEFLVRVYETAGEYLRSNDDLRQLSFDDRSIILRSAADNVTCMGGAFIMQYCQLYAFDSFLKAMNTKYGKHTMDIHIAARKFIDPDIVLVKLAISLFSFSENTCCYQPNILSQLTNSTKILIIQNKYAELTWKYLIYKYGYYDAIRKFLNMTLFLCSMNTLAVHAQTLAPHINDIDSIIEETELRFVLEDVD